MYQLSPLFNKGLYHGSIELLMLLLSGHFFTIMKMSGKY